MPLIRAMAGRVPILGVCLGHQSIGQAFGGQIIRAPTVMHGKTSPVHHTQRGVFHGLANPFEATRYHSLVIDPVTLPECLEVTAWTETEEGTRDAIMGVRHREFPIQGVQFHPESILTQHGHDLLRNFIEGRDE
jgi:anthranilate synthase component 2